MNPEIEMPRKIQLSASQVQQIYERDIVPDIGVVGDPIENPTFSVVSGQPGAGKSTAIRQIRERFQGQPTQIIIPDHMCQYIPGYNDARMAGMDEPLDKSGGSPITEWNGSLVKRAFKQRANIILESCYTPENYRSLLEHAKESGYRLELNILATNRRVSFTGIHDRFNRVLQRGSVDGTVLPDLETHDHYYALVPRLVFHVEKNKLFDSIRIASRGQAPRYVNELVADSGGAPRWKGEPQALRQLMSERNRPLTRDERSSLRQTWERLIDSPSLKTHPETKDLPLADYRHDVLKYLGSKGNLFPPAAETPEVDRKHITTEYAAMFREDRDLILISKSNQGEFSDPDFEYAFEAALESFDDWFSSKIKRVSNSVQETEVAMGHPNQSSKLTHATDTLAIAGQLGRAKRVIETESDLNSETQGPTKRLRQSHELDADRAKSNINYTQSISEKKLWAELDRADPEFEGAVRAYVENREQPRQHQESTSEKRLWAELDRADPEFEAAIRANLEGHERPHHSNELLPVNGGKGMVSERVLSEGQVSGQDNAVRGLTERTRKHGRDN